ncbi:hypothetical protein [Occallatibacter savannae]|uniref:hypothetical protein n=1 Tax=Occallatibacter savannae TaxID=1002691 RepID=UPI000D697C3F|nr:hypothetical protein [Occallatibacter savannae]
MDQTTIIRIVSGVLFLLVLAEVIAYVALLSRVLKKCSPQSRTMQPGRVWLVLVPLFNFVWIFFVVNALADSLENEFRLRNIAASEQKPGRTLGLAMAICMACGIIPIINLVAIIPQLILWIMYRVKISGYSKLLDRVPVPVGRTA